MNERPFSALQSSMFDVRCFPILHSLTALRASVCIAPVKLLLVLALLLAATSCTTLENRRDLYRSPAEGYERWYRRPPPTRLPSTGPASRGGAPVQAVPQGHGVIT